MKKELVLKIVGYSTSALFIGVTIVNLRNNRKQRKELEQLRDENVSVHLENDLLNGIIDLQSDIIDVMEEKNKLLIEENESLQNPKEKSLT